MLQNTDKGGKEMKNKLIIIGITLVIIALSLSGCMNEVSDAGGAISETINPPEFRVTSQSSRDGYEGANKVGYVDVTVKNGGGSGRGTVYVRVAQGNNVWTKEKPINLGNDESTSLTFRFSEIQFWTLDSWYFTSWVE